MPDIDPADAGFIEIAGHRFPLDRIPESPATFAALPRLRAAYGLDTSKLVESDPIADFDPPILYQRQNGCVGHGGCTMFDLAWRAANLPVPDGGFSPTWLYALINGGRDQGAMIGDLVGALTTVGQCSARTFSEEKWMLGGAAEKKAREEAVAYRVEEAYAFDTADELEVALSKGLFVADSVMVGRTFTRLDADGVAGVDGGPGNHCVAKAGLRKFKGKVYYPGQNSWGTQYGKGGRMYTTRDHVNSQRYYSGVAIKAVKLTNPAPAA